MNELSPSTFREHRVCGWPECGQEGDKRCGRCKAIYYCCQEHQINHWTAHKDQCKKLEVKKAEVISHKAAAKEGAPQISKIKVAKTEQVGSVFQATTFSFTCKEDLFQNPELLEGVASHLSNASKAMSEIDKIKKGEAKSSQKS